MNGAETTTIVEPRPARRIAHWLGGRAKAPLRALARFAARSYIAGERFDDALAVARRFRDRDVLTTFGFWDGPHDSPVTVLQAYQAALADLASAKLEAYLSIKLPSLGYSREMFAAVARQAVELGVGLHFDALGPETVDRTWAALAETLPSGEHFGCTLPGRWKRSPADADFAVENRLAVRVVKGQWPDPLAPDLDPRAGYMEVVRRLAGRARHVAVATHDLTTAKRAIETLLAAGTPTTLELLYGLPSRRQIELARQLSVPVRVYIPYGVAYLPYCLAQMKRNPRIAWWLVRDALRRS
jgi:proline dehydrogenase